MTTAQDLATAPPTPDAPALVPGARYALGLLVVVYACNFIDRQILTILMEPIRKELQLTDTQLGLLSGIAFALFYSTLGIPIARLADRRSRKSIIAVCLAFWSLATALSGAVQSFAQLLLARICVGIGEAGCTPPAHSILSDYYPVQRRATAVAIYSLGVPLGTLFGLMAGGWLNQYLGWRAAFLLVGLPGVLLALVVWFTLREPARPPRSKSPVAAEEPSLLGVFPVLWRIPTYRFLCLAAAVQSFAFFGTTLWLASFLIRSYGMDTGAVGTALGLLMGVMGGLGTLLGGYGSDRLARRDRRWYLWLPGLGALASAPLYAAAFLAPTLALTLGLLVVPIFLTFLSTGPGFATAQNLVPPHLRATASAVMLFSVNLIGAGLGPQAVGIISDLVRPTAGEESLRWALAVVCVGYVVGGAFFILAARTIRQDMARAEG